MYAVLRVTLPKRRHLLRTTNDDEAARLQICVCMEILKRSQVPQQGRYTADDVFSRVATCLPLDMTKIWSTTLKILRTQKYTAKCNPGVKWREIRRPLWPISGTIGMRIDFVNIDFMTEA